MDRNDAHLEQLKRAALLRRLKQRQAATAVPGRDTPPPLQPADRAGPLPLSWAQQRLWFLDQLHPAGSAAYQLPVALRLAGRLDETALRAALDHIVARHEVLRTRFGQAGDPPVQLIDPPGIRFALSMHDLRALDGPEQQQAIARHAQAEFTTPFKLAAGPLIRGRLLRLADDQHLLYFNQHHIVSDGWSMGVLVREFAALYAAFCEGMADPLPPLPLQYADYAVWQRRWLQGEVLQTQLDYWRQQLAGAPELLELPTDRPRPPVQDHVGNRQPIVLGPELTAGLKALARRHGVTLFMTLLAGWATVLARLSGQSDLVIGTTVANRQHTALEPLIGFFVNTLALRIDADPGQGVATLLGRIKALTLAAYAHQELPFEQVVEAIRPTRSLSHNPVFQVLLSLGNTPTGGPLALPGLDIEAIDPPHSSTQFDLALTLHDQGRTLTGHLAYATALFDAATIERLAGHFQTLLQAMVADDTRPLHALPLLSPEERRQLLHGWNTTAAPLPEAPVHAWFEAQAAARPEATALVHGGQPLSYGELNRRANQLAHQLRTLGLRPDDRVALCLPRSFEQLVGVFAVLKAGGAYVPLDPAWPAERLAFLLGDSRPVALVTLSEVADRLPAGNLVHTLLLDDPLQQAALADQPDHNPDPAELGLTPQHLAYLIYTSGSTGQPKGVMVEHRGLANYLHWARRYYQISSQASSIVSSPLAFDATITTMYLPLLTGGTVTLLPEGEELAGLETLAQSGRHWDLLKITPAHLALLGQRLQEAGASPPVGCIVIGGEALPASTAALWRELSPEARLINEYGPTETVVGCCIHEATAADLAGDAIPIGLPIANTQLYLLDPQGEPVPLGAVGELWIGGAGVARGYWNRPEQTAGRFLPDPFSNQAPTRLYRTGDLARRRTDGRIEFLGRNDFQVKLRGFRIELGEIEAQLAACPGVREAVVTARDDAAGKRLVAYVVAEAGAELDAGTLRSRLAATLPDYMVPAAYVLLGALPLTRNGKIDRRALPAPDGTAYGERPFAPPQGATEATLAGIWETLLGVSPVGRDDDFFALGGHSLLAVQLVSRIRQLVGVELPLPEVFAAPRLHALATVIGRARQATLPEIRPADRRQPLPLAWAQLRLWFLDRLDPAAGAAYHLPLALRLDGQLDEAALRSALDRLVARHEVLRTTFVKPDDADEPVQRIAPPDAGFALETVDLGNLAAEEQDAAVARLGREEAAQPFDLAQGPLIRGRLLRLADDAHVLLLTQHHIISDGWSIGLLVNEVTTLYGAFSRREPDPLPVPPLQYADYAVWQRRWLQGEVLEAQLAFWRGRLAGAPAVLPLPTDHPRPAVHSYAGSKRPFVLAPELAAGLRQLARRHGATLFMTLLAAWATLLARLSGQSDLVIGTPVANRRRSELEALPGLFVNTLALRIEVDTAQPAAGLLAQVKAATLAAYEHQDVPFEQVVEALQPVRSLSHSPVFQVLLSLDNTPAGGTARLPGLSVTPLELPQATTPFDLALALNDAGEKLTGSLHYATALWDAPTIDRFLRYFRTLLQGLVDDDTRPLWQLPLLDEAERRQLLAGWNATTVPYPQGRLVHQLFEEQAARTPEATAVVDESATLSYAGLAAAADRLAAALQSQGVGAGSYVPLRLERSSALVIAELAILKCGAAYVPLDPHAPPERLAFQIADCRAAVVLGTSDLELPEVAGVRRLDLDAALPHAGPLQPVDVNSESPAYAMYTSGSTGEPKGVVIPHRAVIAHLVNSNYAEFGPDDRIAFAANPAFDSSTLEVWAPLLHGGAIVVIPAPVLLDPEALAARLHATGTTFLILVAGLLTAYADTVAHRFPKLRYLLTGGDVADPRAIARILRHNPPGHLLQTYGPTEATQFATACDIREISDETAPLPLGRPIANKTVYLLDAHQQPVPVGVTGEVYIGGEGVALGYLNRPDLTAERFLDDPFGPAPGARLYRTGDLARWRPDGTLDFLGRNDFQVKLRGFRIELGEIETRLAACPGVREAIVLTRADGPGDKRLVAYFTSDTDPAPDPAELCTRLAAALPDYMVPGAFVPLARWPLTPNGKVDRAALPAPDHESPAPAYEAPVGDAETTIAALWQELLNTSPIGRRDHFFALGGHSLLVVRFIDRLRQRGYVADVRAIFATPVLAELAAGVTRLGSEPPPAAVPPNLIPPAGVDRLTPELLPLLSLTQAEVDQIVATVRGGARNLQDAYPLAPLQEGILFHHLLDDRGDLYLSRTVLAFDRRERLDAFLAALQAVIDRHDILRTAVVWDALAQPVQAVWRRAVLPVTTLELDPEADAIAQLLARTDSRHTRLDLHRAPLLAAFTAQDPATGEWLLALLNHHLISDHVTLELILAEIRLLLQGRGAELAAPVPYRNFIVQARAKPPAGHEAWFRAQLGGVTETTAPFDVLNVQGDTPIREARQPLEPALAARIRAAARRQGVSTATLFHAAWALVLAHCSGRTADDSDVVFGTVLLGRLQNAAEAGQVLGMFMNTLPLRVPVGGRSAAALVADTWQRLNGLLEHEHASLAQAQRCSGVPAPLPLFTALLNYRHSPRNAADDRDEIWSGVRRLSEEARSNYPLTLSVDDLARIFHEVAPGLPPNPLPVRISPGSDGNPNGTGGLEACRTRARRAAKSGGAVASSPDFRYVVPLRASNPAKNRLAPPLSRLRRPKSDRLLDPGFVLTAQAAAGIDPERINGYLATALASLVDALDRDPQQPALDLNILPAAELRQLLVDWNPPACFPAGPLLHQQFEAQAAARPDAVALIYRQQPLSYGDLNRQANQVAHALLALGVQPDDRVAICAERGFELIIGLLAILKAGAGYVPLDPGYPAERLAFLLTDSAPAALLTESVLRSRLPGDRPTLLLDQPEACAGRPAHNPAVPGLQPGHLTYVIYTSGSTGTPKGVMVEHGNVARLFSATAPWFRFGRDDVWTLFHSVAFDFSVWEIWGALCHGGRLVIVPPLTARSPEAFHQLVREAGVTVLNQTPSAFRQLLAAADANPRPHRLRYVIFGGEALDPGTLQPWFRHPENRDTRLVNMYGITETTVHVTYQPLTGDEAPGTSPIGRPIPDLQVYVLDSQRRPVPLGVPGELYVGGAGVARGYLNRPELTEARFLPAPFVLPPSSARGSGAGGEGGDASGAESPVARPPRLYKTGDLVRYHPDGSLDYLGRNDFQVKIRGFRIELGEIEARLTACNGVREAVVLADQAGAETRLLAWYVPASDAEPTAAGLRAELAASLPDYMLPAAYVRLDRLPLTANGKLDRRALPLPDRDAYARRGYEAPAGPVEAAIAEIWRALLGVAEISRHDHFFELGGHSLTAVQLVSRLHQAFGVDVALRELFAHPTLCDQAALIAAAQPNPPAAAPPPIPVADRHQPLPLSWGQLRLWFLDQLDAAAGAAYHLPFALKLRGRLDAAALQATLDRLVARHEILRTTFVRPDEADEPVQRIAPADCGFALERRDLRRLPPDEQAAAVARLAVRPFDLACGPLVRGQLLQLADDEHVLLFTQHHIVSDGWSLGVLVAEVARLYPACCRGEPDPLPPPPLHYADFAVWQRQWLQGETLQAQLAFWRDRLAGAPALLDLPTDHPRPAVQSHAGAGVPLVLGAPLTAGLKALARRHGTTLFMTLLAGWATLLARLSGQPDVVIGTPVANRPRPELEALPGFFVNTLALRVRFDEALTVAGLLAQVKADTLAAFAHQDLPFEQVVEALQPARALSHSPVFQVMLSLDNTPHAALALPGVQLEPLPLPRHTTQFDLTLALTDHNDELAGRLEYASALWEPATIERWAGYLRTLLQAMVDSDRPVRQLPLLNAAERRQLLEGWNDTAAPLPDIQFVHRWFETQAAGRPDAIAAQYRDLALRYGELNRRANQLAHRLLVLGVRPDDRVALCLPRSLELLVAVLGVLKAGGAYVPLDPGYPATRLAFMLDDCRPVALLTHAAGRTRLPDTVVPAIVLDDPAALAGQPDHDPAAADLELAPGNLAYLIYTSGSTGQPKGVMIEHRGLANYLHWARRYYLISSQASSIVSSPLAFDATITTLFLPLLAGGTVTLLPEGEELAGLEALLQDNLHWDLLKITPAHLALLGQRLQEAGATPSVGCIVVGGEALPASTAALWRERCPEARLINEYGPTETVVGCCIHEATSADLTGDTIPIGRPIANMQLYLLDPQGEPVPPGVAGEVWIGGAGVARGYWNRPELTAERFVPDPFSSAPEARLYQTGDLARRHPDGVIEFLGRNDFQVKIRGFRIEPGEIEAQLKACPGVRDAVVTAREDGPAGKRLVAYLVAAGKAPATDDLRSRLATVLPDYLRPAAYVWLDTLPLTANGKVDRAALPAPEGDAYPKRAYAPPAGPLETALAEIWATLLGVSPIGRHDHFFTLGGHSLLAVQLTSRLRQRLGIELALREVFAHPVLQDMAAAAHAADRAALPPIPAADRNRPLPLSWAQQRLWFLDQLDAAAGAAYHMPMVLRLRGKLDRHALQATLDRIVARHEVLRTRFRKPADGGEPLQHIGPPETPFALDCHDLQPLATTEQQAAVERLGTAESRRPFDLANGPLIRGSLLQLADDDHLLFFNQHHIISDGWSIGVLVKEVAALYAAFSQGGPDPLPPLPLQYADYAVWQRRWLQGAALQRQLGYWTGTLAGAPALLPLPTDQPRPAVQRYAGASLPFVLPAPLTASLRALGERHGTTLFMTLLAGWAAVLARLASQSEVVVGTPVANRPRAELEPLLGFFVNTLALRVRLDPEADVATLLGQVKALTLDAYAQQDVPFEQVVEALQPVRSLAHSPVFQVMLALNNTPGTGALALPGLALETVEQPHTTAQFDLFLSLTDAGEVIAGHFVYATSLFDEATIERWAGHFRTLLAALAADDQQPLQALPLLGEPERRQLLAGWNDTAAPYPDQALIHQRFESQGVRPAAIALVHGRQALSYGELNRRANRIAHRLRALGVQPDDRVALCVERGLDMVAGLLGILKAGGAYVPLDPAYPADRLAFMLDDSAPVAVLTQAGLREALPATSAPVLLLDEATTFDDCPDTNPPPTAASHHLAYVIYTSGSTGRPKGVMVEHRSVVNFLAAMEQAPGLTADDVLLAVTTLSFDIAGLELYLPLCTGARIVLADRAQAADPVALAGLIADHKVTVLQATPATWRMLLDSGWTGAPALKALCGGEALPRELSTRLAGRVGELWNLYGPTETTIWSSCRRVAPAAHGASDPESIGRPIANTRCYVLDARLQPVPIGVAGELYIGGHGLARGYLNRPELTAERFIANPFSDEPRDRLYKTGDLARWRPDGSLDYLGRNDFQVKVRGFRVEPGEIEARLATCPGVRTAAVVARPDNSGEQRLVAYVVPDEARLAEAVPLDEAGVADWSNIFDAQLDDGTDAADAAGFDNTVWVSSYTRQPIPLPEMQDWLHDTTTRIRALQPRRVLEIGCGTGMVLYRLAPDCERYVGTDLAPRTVERLRRQLAARPDLCGRTEVICAPAADFSQVPAREYDTVVLNSVVQYFPSLDYLCAVLRQALALVGPRGHVFLGDIRHFGLLDAFHLSVQLAQAPDALPLPELLARAAEKARSELELLVDPRWFHTLPALFPEITGVEVLPKTAAHQNEMSAYRYDVVLAVRQPARPAAAPHDVAWLDGSAPWPELQARLLAAGSTLIGLRCIPNPRVQPHPLALAAMAGSAAEPTAGALRLWLRDTAKAGVTAADLATFCAQHGYALRLSGFPSTPDGRYHALIAKSGAVPAFDWRTLDDGKAADGRCANDPQARQRLAALPERLRQTLAAVLPDYLLPSAYVLLDRLPLTPNGKVDRQALPAPDQAASASRGYEPPQTELETALAGLWQDVLGACRTFGREGENALKRGQFREDLRHVAGLHNESRNENGPFPAPLQPAHRKSDRLLGIARVGRQDHFFALGGHSLLAVQLIARLRQVLGVDVPLRELFAHPTLQAFAQVVAQAARAELPPIPPADRRRPLPLTGSQQRLWFLDQLDPAAGAAYHLPLALKLQGRLDVAALQAALDQVVARHEVLRTTFVQPEGATEPVQRIHPPAPFALGRVDLQALPPAEQQAALARIGRDEVTRRFDLAAGPLIRGTLLQLADDEHALWLTQHHIVSDGWSLGVLANEVATLYAAFACGKPDPLPPLPLQYADYAAWQRQWLQGEVLQAQLDFWRNTLAGAPALHEVPTDHPRPASSGYTGASHAFRLPAALSAGLKALAQRHGTTLFMTLLAAWATLLARLSGQRELVIGTPAANRPRSELEPLIGFFVNTLALRIEVDPALPAAALLARVKALTLDAYAHQDVPFEQVVEALQPARSLSHNPVFQLLLSLDNTPGGGAVDVPGLRLAALDLPQTTTPLDLALSLTDTGTTIAGKFIYATALWDAPTIERYARYWQNLLQALVADDTLPLWQLPLLDEAERRQLLAGWNATTVPYPQGRLVHQLFEEQAARTPGATAVVDTETLRYADLDTAANHLAAVLQSLGVRPGSYVPLLLERSSALVIAELAILKCGAAYVPLDPHAPPERLAFQIADCRAAVVLSTCGLELPAVDGVRRLDLDAALPHAGPRQPVDVNSESPAYVMYTSGSTGEPKGVVIPHRAVVAHLVNSNYAEFGPDDRIAFASNPAFDSSTLEVWAPLLHGGAIVVIPAPVLLDPEALAARLKATGTTILILVAGLLTAYADTVAHRFPKLRYLLTGGDVADPRAIARILRHNPPGHLLQTYGPTEATQFATACDIREISDETAPLPLGRPIANKTVYLLDAHQQPVPVGVTGEVYIGGEGVALGYLNRPDLTAERFLDDPFGPAPGARLYRTGDLARWRPDGTLDFLGRNDFQVKLRGFRIELGEIETRLAACPGVREAIVLARDDAPGEKQLAAYVAPAAGAALAPDALRRTLAALLPDYMVPAAVVVLDAFPLTPNGKVDRRALPAPAPGGQAAFEPPAGEIETRLAAIWAEALQRDPAARPIGRHDNFFELGGHSLLAVAVITRMRQQGLRADVRTLFTAPTLAALAAATEKVKRIAL